MDMQADARKTGPRDVFLHLASTIGLYVTVVAFGSLLFQMINVAFPDPALGDFRSSTAGALRWPLSVLVIVFPVYIWISYYVQKDLLRFSEKRELKTRKWMLYFTLFAAGAVIVVDLITLIFQFLGGDLTVRFILKVATVLIVAAAVFAYYLWNLKNATPALRDPHMRYFVWGMVALVAAAVVSGFVIAGSPFEARLTRIDERRVEHLRTLQFEIVNFWQAKEVLPAELRELRDEIRGFTPPVDPVTGELYEYRPIGPRSFELCAVFQTSNIAASRVDGRGAPIRDPFGGVEETFLHDAERTCFSRTIDPDRFPPFKR